MADFPFPGNCRGAISLTYDDNLDPHFQHAMPDLEAHGLRGTFFVISRAPGLAARRADWRSAAARGHEIGNHTQFHPCSGKFPWVKPENAIELYDLPRMGKELQDASAEIVQLLEAPAPVSFAYPCGHTWVGPQQESYRPLAASHFAACRNGGNRHADPRNIEFDLIPAFIISLSQSLDAVKAWVDGAIDGNQWTVLSFHGVGGGHGIDVPRELHQSLCDYVEQRRADLYCDTFANVARHIRQATGRPWGV